MELRDYTGFNEVRAALGVSDKEISDETLSLDLYRDNLLVEMDKIGDSFATEYDALLVAQTTTTDQARLLRAGRLFCTYVVANHLLSSLPLFAPKDISDGKAQFARQGENPFLETIRQVRGRYSQYVAAVAEAYDKYKTVTTTVTAPVFMRASSPTTNPITG